MGPNLKNLSPPHPLWALWNVYPYEFQCICIIAKSVLEVYILYIYLWYSQNSIFCKEILSKTDHCCILCRIFKWIIKDVDMGEKKWCMISVASESISMVSCRCPGKGKNNFFYINMFWFNLLKSLVHGSTLLGHKLEKRFVFFIINFFVKKKTTCNLLNL